MPQYPLGPTPSNGEYYPAAIQGNLYRGGNQAAVATAMTSGLPTTYTGGLVLSNPIASSVNLVLQDAAAALVAKQTNASCIGVGVAHSGITAISGTLTAVPIQAAVVGNDASGASGKLYSSASITLPVAPALSILVGVAGSGAVTAPIDAQAFSTHIDGRVVVPPGGYAVFTSTATGTASSFLGSFTWTELPAGATVG